MAVNNNKTIFREYNKQQHQQQTWQLHSKKILSINIYYVTYVCVCFYLCDDAVYRHSGISYAYIVI